MKRRPAAFMFLGAFVGAHLAYCFTSSITYGIGFCISALLAVIPRPWLRIVAFLSALFFLGAYTLSVSKERYEAITARLPPDRTRYIGTIDSVAYSSDGPKTIIAQVRAPSDSDTVFSLRVHLRGATAALIAIPGSTVEFIGQAQRFEEPLSPDYFDAKRFGLIHGIHGSLMIADADAIAIGPKTVSNFFATMRHTFRMRAMSILSPHEASLVLALVIGDTSLFSLDERAVFANIGAQHLLAVSGLQITLLAWLCFFLLYPFFAILLPCAHVHRARAIAAMSTSVLLFCFVGLCGFSPSAVRALIMAICLFLPLFVPRPIDAFDALFAAGFLTVLCSPVSALDLGFLLSYSSVIGLMLAHRHLLKAKTAGIFLPAIRNAVVYSFSASIATLPIILFYIGRVAPWSVFANAVLVPFMSLCQIPTIVFGLLGCLGDVSWPLQVAAVFANSIEIATSCVSHLFGGQIIPPYLSPAGLALCSLALIALVLAPLNRSMSLAGFAVLISLWPMMEIMHRDNLKITVIPVGQGDATLFSFDSGEHMLIDAGGAVFGAHDPGLKNVVPTLQRNGVAVLDVLVISHPDPDHIKGAFAVLDQITVKEIWHSGYNAHHPLSKQLLAEAARRSILVKTTKEIFGMHRFGSSEVHVIAPMGEDFYPELHANDNSLVLQIINGKHSLLWPGDLEYFGEELLMHQAHHLKADILKAPHHGSSTSSSDAFIDRVAPRAVIFSTGRYNQFSHPHDSVVARYKRRGIAMWNTAEHGQITISVGPKNFSIDAYQKPFKEKS